MKETKMETNLKMKIRENEKKGKIKNEFKCD